MLNSSMFHLHVSHHSVNGNKIDLAVNYSNSTLYKKLQIEVEWPTIYWNNWWFIFKNGVFRGGGKFHKTSSHCWHLWICQTFHTLCLISLNFLVMSHKRSPFLWKENVAFMKWCTYSSLEALIMLHHTYNTKSHNKDTG